MKLPLAYRKRKYLSYSTLCDFVSCPRKYLLSSGFGVTTASPHAALKFGSAIHNGIAAWHVNFSHVEMTQAFDAEWDENLADDKRNRIRGYALLARYASGHGPGQSIYSLIKPPECDSFIKLPGSQSAFEVGWVMDIGLDVPLVGKIDALGYHRATGEMIILEWKTTGQLGPMFWSAFQLSNQLCLYGAACQVGGLPIKRALVEGLKVVKTQGGEEVQGNFIDLMPHKVDAALRWAQRFGRILLETEKRFQESGEDARVFEQYFSGCHPYSAFGMPGFACRHQLVCGVEDPSNLLRGATISPERAFPIGGKDE